jgi:signal peptidase I
MSVARQGESQPVGPFHWLRVITIGRNPKRTLIRIAVLIVASVVVFRYVLLPVRVTGISMEPTYHDRSINFINRLAYLRHPPERGDVVGIRFSGIHDMLMKRIVGLPGETVSFSGGHVWINGVRQEEPYLVKYSDWAFPVGTLGPDEFYVVGDNRSMPQQYHDKGRATRDRIVGKVFLAGNPPP